MNRPLAALLFALSISIAAPLDAVAEGNVLWSVRGEHNTVYLFGSIHVLRPTDAALPHAAAEAYADAEQLVMEIDMDNPAMADPAAMAAQMQRSALLPAGQSLRSVLGDDYAAIAERTRREGLDLGLLDPFAPWFVATMLLQLEIAQRGFDAAHGIEQQLAERAIADRKPILGLETPEQQFAVLGGLSLAEQKRFLLLALEETEEDDTELEELMAAWRTGDTAALARILSEAFAEFPELYRPLTEDRNRAWIDDLESLLDDRDDYLVVVGALHLVGRNSVLDLLQRRGHTVTRH